MVDTEGRVFSDAVVSPIRNFTNNSFLNFKQDEGDVWYFPAGIPHSLQATADDPDGSEFLLVGLGLVTKGVKRRCLREMQVFDNGSFSEESSFQLTDWTAHLPKEVLAKNFQLDESAFDRIPSKQLYIFPGSTVLPSDRVFGVTNA